MAALPLQHILNLGSLDPTVFAALKSVVRCIMSDASNMYPNYNAVLDQSLTTSPLPINEITEKLKNRKRAVQPKVGGHAHFLQRNVGGERCEAQVQDRGYQDEGRDRQGLTLKAEARTARLAPPAPKTPPRGPSLGGRLNPQSQVRPRR